MEKEKTRKLLVVLSFFVVVVAIFILKNKNETYANDEDYVRKSNINYTNGKNSTNESTNFSNDNYTNSYNNGSNDNVYASAENTQSKEEINNVDHYLQYCKRNIKIDKKYVIVRSSIKVQKYLTENEESSESIILEKGTRVTVKSVPNDEKGNLYVLLQTEEGQKYYDSLDSFYDHSELVGTSSFVKSIHNLKYKALGKGKKKDFLACIAIASIFVFIILRLIARLDETYFIPLKEGELPENNGLYKIIPGAMFGTFITLMVMCNENLLNYYFYDGGFSLLFSNYTAQMVIMQAIIFLIIGFLFMNFLESKKYYVISSVILRMLLIIVANLFTSYICYTTRVVGIIVYVVIIVFQCMHFGMENVVEEAKEA